MSTDKYTSVSLSDIAVITMGQSPAGASMNEKDGVEFHQGKIFFSDCYLKESNVKTNAPTKIANPGDIIFCVRAPVGVVNITERQICIGRGLAALSPKPNIPRYYLFSLLNTLKNQFEKVAAGSTFSSISGPQLKQFPVTIHSDYDTMKQIASELYSIDSMISSLQKIITKQEAIKKSTVKLLMTPKPGWHQYLLGDCVTIFTGATPSTEHSEYWNGEIPWMSSGEVNSRFIYRTNAFITQEGYNATSTHMIPVNSVLIALAGQGKTRGKVAINKIELCTNQSLASLLPNLKLDYQFLFYNLEERYEELRELSSGDGGRGGLNVPILKNLPIVLPPVNEQHRIAQKISNLDISIQNFAIQLKKAQDVKMGMMSYFFD